MAAILFNENEEFVAFVDKFAILYQKMKKNKNSFFNKFKDNVSLPVIVPKNPELSVVQGLVVLLETRFIMVTPTSIYDA